MNERVVDFAGGVTFFGCGGGVASCDCVGGVNFRDCGDSGVKDGVTGDGDGGVFLLLVSFFLYPPLGCHRRLHVYR